MKDFIEKIFIWFELLSVRATKMRAEKQGGERLGFFAFFCFRDIQNCGLRVLTLFPLKNEICLQQLKMIKS
jgi:hypothetical protein